MKKLSVIGLIVLSTLSISLNALAIPSFPRELSCQSTADLSIVKLQSNNGFWSIAENGRYNVALVISKNGSTEIATAKWTNANAKITRGNDAGLKQYVFTTTSGTEYQVNLEFFAKFGQATGLKIFTVTSTPSDINIDAAADDCGIQLFPRIEI
jgi:hypothetical protein